MVLLCLAGRCSLSVQFWMGLTAARLPGSRFRHPLRILLCMTSSFDGSAAKKYIYTYIYICSHFGSSHSGSSFEPLVFAVPKRVACRGPHTQDSGSLRWALTRWLAADVARRIMSSLFPRAAGTGFMPSCHTACSSRAFF